MKQKLEPYIHTDGKRWDHFFFDPRSLVMYFMKSHNGRKIKFSCKCTTSEPVKAKRFANAEFDKRTGKNTRFVRTLIKEELKSWRKLKESEGIAESTMRNIRRAEKHIPEFWGNRLPSEINRDTFAEWCAWWRENHPEIEMENAVKYFNNFCNYLHEKVVNGRPLLPSRLRFQDPNRKLIKAKRARKKERVLTHDEFKQIYDSAENEVEALVVLFMYTMATRIEETLNLDTSRILLDLDVPLYRWTVDSNKAERVGEHALHPSLIEPLRALRGRRTAEGTHLFFPQKNNNQRPLKAQQVDWDAWRKRAGVGFHWTPHTFRHTCLTNLFNDPKNPHAVICKLYRVSLAVALETYVKVTRESMLAIKDAIEVVL